MRLASRDRKLLMVLAIAGVLIGYWFLILTPKREESAKLDRQLATIEQKVAKEHAQLASYHAAQGSYAADYSTVVRLGEAIPKDEGIASLLVQLDSLASGGASFTQVGIDQYPQGLLAPSLAGTQTSQATGQPPQAASAKTGSKTDSSAQPQQLPFQPVELRLQFQGNFFRMHTLFKQIERLVRVSSTKVAVRGRLVFIEGFNVKEGRAGFPHVSINVGALVFSLPEGQSITAGATVQAPAQAGAQPAAGSGGGTPPGGSGSEPVPAATSTPPTP